MSHVSFSRISVRPAALATVWRGRARPIPPVVPGEGGAARAADPLAASIAAPGPAESSGSFRPDVEGMRGLAVVLVLLYHAAVPGWPGGYVGVDVFFVLSGFLITGLMLRELEATGGISLPRFYARRSRRILPAAALVLVATVVASALFLPPIRVPGIAIDGIWAAVYSANIHFAAQATDYLQADLAPSPLIHYWSLGVEEQFYLFWPALLLIVVRRRPNILRRAGIVAVAVIVVSFVLSLQLTATDAPWAFFSLPTRAWEFGIGALLAVVEMRRLALPSRVAGVGGWAGLALIAAAGILFNADTPFPGTAALVPTVGALLVIASGTRPSSFGPARLLSSAIPRFFGRISYSLYLWSWPLLVVPAGALDVGLPLDARLALVGLAIPLATLTQHVVEQPLRRGRIIGTLPRRNLALAGALSVVVVAVSLGAYGRAEDALASEVAAAPIGTATGSAPDSAGAAATGGPTTAGDPGAADPSALDLGAFDVALAEPTGSPTPGGRLPADLRPSLASVRDDAARTYSDGCHLAAKDTRFGECAYGNRSSSTTVVLFGDSHAAQWFPALERLATDRSWRLLSRTKSACGSADVAVWSGALKRPYTECARWRDAVIEGIAAEHPTLVVLANDRTASVMVGGTVVTGAARDRAWSAGLERTIQRLEALGASVAVVGDTPRPGRDVPECLSRHPADTLACATPRASAIDARWLDLEETAAARAGGSFVDPTDWVCPSAPCPAVIGSFLVFRDSHHLTTPFAAALSKRLGAALPALPTLGP